MPTDLSIYRCPATQGTGTVPDLGDSLLCSGLSSDSEPRSDLPFLRLLGSSGHGTVTWGDDVANRGRRSVSPAPWRRAGLSLDVPTGGVSGALLASAVPPGLGHQDGPQLTPWAAGDAGLLLRKRRTSSSLPVPKVRGPAHAHAQPHLSMASALDSRCPGPGGQDPGSRPGPRVQGTAGHAPGVPGFRTLEDCRVLGLFKFFFLSILQTCPEPSTVQRAGRTGQ